MELHGRHHALRTSMLCCLAGALAWAWELLARQAPSSPWHVAGYPEALSRLGTHAWLEAALLFALVPAAWPRLALRPRLARATLAALLAGTALALGSLAYSGYTGQPGWQLRGGGPLVLSRVAGELLLGAVLVVLGRGAMAQTSAQRNDGPSET